jgi:ATP-dependent Lon protease
MYKEIAELRPYFFSIREFNSTEVSLDVKLPLLWEVSLDVTGHPNMRFKEQDRNDVTKLMSFVNEKTEQGYIELFKRVKGIITYNLEKERKERLLEEKINELKKIFQEKDLTSLENLKFNEMYEDKGTTGIGLSDSEGYGEDSIRATEP